MIELGMKLKDKVTGLTGIAVAKVEYLNGCVQYCVKPEMGKDKKYPDGQYIDVAQLEVVGKGLSLKKKATGGVMGDTPSSNYR